MRTAVLVAVLGTVVCIAWVNAGEGNEDGTLFRSNGNLPLPKEKLNAIWKEAEKHYQAFVKESFVNGSGATRSRRHTKMTPFSEEFSELSNIHQIYEDILESRHRISKRQAATSSPAACRNPVTQCTSNSRFRTVDGTCNNVNNPTWGASNRAFNRMRQQAYNDGFNTPRGDFNSFLPNPRLISTTVHPDNTSPSGMSTKVTNMVPQFGQFLDHDMTLTPEANSQCCSSNNNANPADCWPINVAGDSFYASRSTRCMDFTRSTPCIGNNGIREQMNANTAYLDAGQIYGSTLNRSRTLRTLQGGMLRTHPSLTGFLPLSTNLGVQNQGAFVAGDDRINEMPALAVMHNVFIMEHNRIATQFQRLRPTWNDERIYQETKRIVTAELQQVTYNEYLPIVLGPQAMNDFQLSVADWSIYNSGTDATIFNEFATAAYRFGHSMIAGLVKLIAANNVEVGSYSIANEYFESKQITRDNGQGYDLILRGLMTQNSAEMDRFVTTGVTNFLFKPQNTNFGSDLVARNIQRGRDHGLGSFSDYRELCLGTGFSLRNAQWGVVPPYINAEGWSMASRVYSRPVDIDLFAGGLIEIPVSGGISGPTFTCLKAQQFRNLKFGDRYFFSHDLASGFTPAQFMNLKNRRLGDIICENSQQPTTPRNVFLSQAANNPLDSCTGRPTLDLTLYN